MANLRPKLSEIIERITNDAQARLNESQLRRSDLSVFIRVLAGVSNGLYDAISYGRKQLFVDTADTSYLDRTASIFGLNRKQAIRAKGTAKFTYASSAVDVDVGTLLQDDNGNQFQTTTSPDGEGNVSIQSVFAGSTYNIESGVNLSLPSPLLGISGAITTSAIEGGTDAETDEELRARTLARTQNPPRQGTKSDFIAWAKEVEGVGSAWVYPKELGDGTVTVRFVTTDNEIPDETLVKKVQSHLEEEAFILAKVNTEAPIEQPINFNLTITPDTLANRELAEQALKELFRQESQPGGTIYLSHINAKLSAISSEDDHVIVSPTENIVADSSVYMPVVGEITWTE